MAGVYERVEAAAEVIRRRCGPPPQTALILGSGLGGVAVTDRLYLLRLTRPDEVGEMFGLYGLAGKLSAVIGPLLSGGIILVLDPARIGPVAYQVAILSLLVLMVVGILIVRGVPEPPPAPDDTVEQLLVGVREEARPT